MNCKYIESCDLLSEDPDLDRYENTCCKNYQDCDIYKIKEADLDG